MFLLYHVNMYLEFLILACTIYILASGCPFLSNKRVWKGYNDLATKYPELAKEWHPTKNGRLQPSDVTPGSKVKVWWYLPYDDPETGKHFDFEWQAVIYSRSNNRSCPFLSSPAKEIWRGYNDLETRYPDIAKEWHPTKNGSLKPSEVSHGSGVKVWWYLPYDDPETVVLCQDLVQVKMRNFSHFNPPEAQPQCVFFHTIVRIHLVTYSYNGYEFVSYCRKLPDIRKSSGMPACNREF